ncbi:hypothetical protein TWF481_006544 [Arthrobotrys musiformis]|uniref:H15 domain-containing protein n=1 Tax=Arthrobotrys musiformis TaxID=47236 RepID=A0AAV9W9R1_9PEZI
MTSAPIKPHQLHCTAPVLAASSLSIGWILFTMDHGKRNRSVNMTLVGLALKEQKDGQPFSSAAAETLQKHFPSIPPDILVERVKSLQKTRDELVVNKYGNVITMRQIHTGCSSKASSSSDSVSETVVAGELPEGIDGVRSSPSRSGPQRRNRSHFPLHIPDLDSLVITDSEDDEKTVIHDIHPERSPTRTLRPGVRSQDSNPEPQKPGDFDFSSSMGSPTTKQTPKAAAGGISKTSPAKMPVNIKPVTPTLGVTYASPGSHHRSTPEPSEYSPIKKMLNNRASRLRAQSNLQKISGFESPKHGRLNFEKHSPAKGLSPPLFRTNAALDAENSFAAIDKFYRRSPRRLKDKKQEYENKKDNSPTTPDSFPIKITKPPLRRYFTNESGDLVTGPSSLVFQMDEDMHFQENLARCVEGQANNSDSVNGDIQINVQGDTVTTSTAPQILSEISESYRNKSPTPSKPFMCQAGPTNPMKSNIRKISLQGIKNDEQLDTDIELIKSEIPSEPSVLNVKVGSRGLIMNIFCAGDLVMGDATFN